MLCNRNSQEEREKEHSRLRNTDVEASTQRWQVRLHLQVIMEGVSQKQSYPVSWISITSQMADSLWQQSQLPLSKPLGWLQVSVLICGWCHVGNAHRRCAVCVERCGTAGVHAVWMRGEAGSYDVGMYFAHWVMWASSGHCGSPSRSL